MGKPQLMQDVGEVDKLTTTSKEVVGAINEVKKDAFPVTGGAIKGDTTVVNGVFRVIADDHASIGLVADTGGNVVLQADNNLGILYAQNSSGVQNRRQIALRNLDSTTDDKVGLTYLCVKDGVATNYLLYGEHNKPVDETLASLGFSGNEFSETDLSGNIALILSKMKSGQTLSSWAARDNAFVNLANSINAYLGLDTDYTINISCFVTTTVPNIINFMTNESLNIYQFSYDNYLRFRGNISQLANYTNLKMLGLTDTCTPSELAKAMPNYSTLNMVAYQTSHPNLELPQGYGVLEVKRFTANYCSFTFRTSVWTSTQPLLYIAHYHTSNNVWTGWQPCATTSTIQQVSDLEKQVADLEIQLLMSN